MFSNFSPKFGKDIINEAKNIADLVSDSQHVIGDVGTGSVINAIKDISKVVVDVNKVIVGGKEIYHDLKGDSTVENNVVENNVIENNVVENNVVENNVVENNVVENNVVENNVVENN